MTALGNVTRKISKSVIAYVSATYGITFVLGFFIFRMERFGDTFVLITLVPSIVASVLIRFFHRRSFSDYGLGLSRGLGGGKALFFAISFPCFHVCLLVFAAFFLAPLVTKRPLVINLHVMEQVQNVGLITYFLEYVVLSVVSILTINWFFAFGEEFGWRGYLVRELYRVFGIGSVVLISGIVWAFWHIPLIILSPHAPYPVLEALVYAANILCLTPVLTWLLLNTKNRSVYPVALFHSSWNVINQQLLGEIIFNQTGILESQVWLINGEGLIGLLVSLPLAIFFYHKILKMKREDKINLL